MALTRSARQGGGYYPAFLDLVREQLGHDYDATELASRGYRVFTTLEPRVQDAAEQAVAATLDRIEIDRKLPHGDLESAVLVANNQTGEISAVVGGRKAIRNSSPTSSRLGPVRTSSFRTRTTSGITSILFLQRRSSSWRCIAAHLLSRCCSTNLTS